MFSAKSYLYFLLLIQGVLLQSDNKDERVGEAGRDGGQERCGQDARVLTGIPYRIRFKACAHIRVAYPDPVKFENEALQIRDV
jgi:hypothetical protein